MCQQEIPLCDLKAEYEEIRDEVNEAVLRVLASGRYILGPELEAFESEVANYLGVKHAIGVANGSDSLYLALRALNVGPGDEVIVPAFTFFATAGSVVRVGAMPVFADIRPDIYNLDPEDFAKRITRRTKAVIPVHLYGQPADMAEIMETAREHGLYVIEDAAQAFGARYRGQPAGTIGDVGCFSFFPTKNLGAYGDAGMVVTDDDDVADRVRLLRVHGARPKYYHHEVGINSRLDELQAAILRVKLRHVDRWNENRRAVADAYSQGLKRYSLDRILRLPTARPDRTHVFHQYVVAAINEGVRRHLIGELEERGVSTLIYYPRPLTCQPALAVESYEKPLCPNAKLASSKVLALPLGSALTFSSVSSVVEGIYLARVSIPDGLV